MNIAIIDDQDDIKYAIEKILQKENHTCYGFCGDEDDLAEGIRVFDVQLIILDMMLKDSLTGLDIVKKLKEKSIEIPIIMITAYTTPSNMIEASKSGITDIIQKPFSAKEILETVNKYSSEKSVRDFSLIHNEEEFIGSYKSMKEVYKLIGIASSSDSNILISGDTGSGKDLIAKLIHKNSSRSEEPFVAINCSTIPENMFEKLMYGRVDNYFKNNESKHIGHVQKVKKGTLYLDEISNLHISLQTKLVRFLETKSYYPVGSSEETIFEGRVICSSLLNSKELLKNSLFRDDLYYRIATLEIALPNLENRKEDIKELSKYFIKYFSRELNVNSKILDKNAIDFLENHVFKGNVRELKNLIYKIMILSRKDTVSVDDLKDIIYDKSDKKEDYLKTICSEVLELYKDETIKDLFIDFEKEILKNLLIKEQNISKVARNMAISRNTLKDKIKKYSLEEFIK